MLDFDWRLIVDLLLAATCGAVLGLERELHRKPAGLRTNMMIALGAALFTYSSIGLVSEAGRGDPARIAAQIVTGIGFLGAGTILRHEDQVLGLTSAATVWVVAAIGILAGANRPLLAATGTVIALLILNLVGRVEGWLMTLLVRGQARLLAEDREGILTEIEAWMRREAITVTLMEHQSPQENQIEVKLEYQTTRQRHEKLGTFLNRLDGVRECRLRIL